MIYLVRKKNICKTLLTVILIVLSIGSSAQEIPFIPPVYNYTTNIYRAGNQNWAAEQGSNGVIYFGNENGLLSFDGVNWSLCPLPNNLSVKSIYIDNNHSTERIYVGSFEEFGYFERNRSNQLIYYSIKSIVDDYQFHNDEIWTIYPFDGKIYFQSFSAFFVFDGKEVRTFKPYPAVLYFFPSGDKMFAQIIDNDFCSFNGEDFQRLLTRKQLNNADVRNTGPADGEIVVQLYTRQLVASVTRPVKELKGFKKIALKAGESKQVTFNLASEDLAFYGIDMKKKTEPGDFKLWIAQSSADNSNEASFSVTQ